MDNIELIISLDKTLSNLCLKFNINKDSSVISNTDGVKIIKSSLNKIYLSKLINLNFKDKNIYASIKDELEGYNKSIGFISDGFKVYFTDDTIEMYSDIIMLLEKKRLLDSFRFIKKIITLKQLSKYEISILDGSKKEVIFEDVISYITGDINKSEVNELEISIDNFVKAYGLFDSVNVLSDKICASNNSKLVINGINNCPNLKDKIISLMKE